jgi:hypothetical protein
MTWRFALVVLVATRAWACSCSGNWPSVKQAWEKAPFVFLGTVEIADPDEDGSQTIFKEQSIRIRVDEAFKGVSKGQLIELREGANDCAAKFRTSQRAVFYFHGTPGDWVVPPCTRALGSPEPTADDLLFLRGLPRSAIGTRLSGEVELYEDSPTEAFRRVGGVAKVGVKILGPAGFTRETITNAAGAYEVFGLRPGRYSVSIEVPKGLKVKFPLVSGSSWTGDNASVELAPNGNASVGFVLQADTWLSGRMLDAQGVPMIGVCIDLEPVEGRGENGARFFDCSKTSGFFEMKMMPPGKYWLVARDEVRTELLKSTSTLYYPGVRDRQRATIVSIEAGKQVERVDIRMPSGEKRHKITGQLQFADGVPASDATVTFTSPQHGYSETVAVGRDGSFALPVVAGMEGQLTAQLAVMERILRSCPEWKVQPRRRGMFRFMDASPISVLSDSDHEGLKLELPSPSCSSWPPGRK